MSVTLTSTLETPLTPDPNWPSGYSEDLTFSRNTFDFGRNWFYAPISHAAVGGIVVKDLGTMHVLATPTSDQLYAGTAFGVTPGVPWVQGFVRLISGINTDLYAIVQVDVFHNYFTRIDPDTLKISGEIISNTAVEICAVNTTTSHEIVAASTSTAPYFWNGTAVTFLAFGPTPTYGHYNLIPGMRRGDGSCDFLLFDADNGGSGNIDIWRVNVSDAPAITSTKTGTFNVLTMAPLASTGLVVTEAEYDVTHDRAVLFLNTGAFGTDPATTIVSVNYDGTINWTFPTMLPASAYNKGQSRLTGASLMIGESDELVLLNTESGAVVFTGSILIDGTSAGSYFRIWDASRLSYWTYALSRGFVRINISQPPLAMDNVIATIEPDQELNLISLRWSDDRGHAWGSPVSQDIGAIGEYRTSLQWQRLSYTRDRVFELSWSVPMPTALIGAWVDVTSAGS